MTLEEGLNVLQEHNKWRLGKAPYHLMGGPSPDKPEKVTQVLGYAIGRHHAEKGGE